VRHTHTHRGQALPILWSEKEEVRIGYPNRNGRPSSEFPSFLREPHPFSFPPSSERKGLTKKKRQEREKEENKKEILGTKCQLAPLPLAATFANGE
jgi:hypothetical protein